MDQPRPLIAIVTDEQAEQIKAMMLNRLPITLLPPQSDRNLRASVRKSTSSRIPAAPRAAVEPVQREEEEDQGPGTSNSEVAVNAEHDADNAEHDQQPAEDDYDSDVEFIGVVYPARREEALAPGAFSSRAAEQYPAHEPAYHEEEEMEIDDQNAVQLPLQHTSISPINAIRDEALLPGTPSSVLAEQHRAHEPVVHLPLQHFSISPVVLRGAVSSRAATMTKIVTEAQAEMIKAMMLNRLPTTLLPPKSDRNLRASVRKSTSSGIPVAPRAVVEPVQREEEEEQVSGTSNSEVADNAEHDAENAEHDQQPAEDDYDSDVEFIGVVYPARREVPGALSLEATEQHLAHEPAHHEEMEIEDQNGVQLPLQHREPSISPFNAIREEALLPETPSPVPAEQHRAHEPAHHEEMEIDPSTIQRPPQRRGSFMTPQKIIAIQYDEQDSGGEAMEVEWEQEQEQNKAIDEPIMDQKSRGRNSIDLRPRSSKVEYRAPCAPRKKFEPPIVASNANRATISKLVDGHHYTINLAGEVVIDDEEIMSDDEDFEEAEANYQPRQYIEVEEFPVAKVPTQFSEYLNISREAQELSDGHVLRYPGDREKSFLECMEEEEKKLEKLSVEIKKIRDFPFSHQELDTVWDTTPMSESARAMWPTHQFQSGVFMAQTMIKQIREDWENGQFTAPEEPMKWLREQMRYGRMVKASLCTPPECHMEMDSVCLVDVVERNENTARFFDKYASSFPKTVPELRKLMRVYQQQDKLYRMLRPRNFETHVILEDLLKMVHEKYMPCGGMYLKLLLNVAFHFQYRVKETEEMEKGWEMVVFEEERLYEGIEFNQSGEPTNPKLAPNIHDRLEAKAAKAAGRTSKVLAAKSDEPDINDE